MNPDLVSVVFLLRPEREAAVPLTTGRAVHAAFMDLVKQVDPDLSDRLHSPSRFKPFTVSPLHSLSDRRDDHFLVYPTNTYWLRFTSLDATLSTLLLNLRPDDFERINLAGAAFDVVNVIVNSSDHPWANQATFDALARRWLDDDWSPPRKIRLRFVTPTTFVSDDQNIPLPLPHLVFFQLGEKWRQYAPMPLASLISRLFDEPVHSSSTASDEAEKMSSGHWLALNRVIGLSQYDLKTRILDFVHYKQVGFTGQVEFLVHESFSDEQTKLLHLLADFAFFAGVGYKTTMGMGQVYPLIKHT
ncbi:MAG: CRISPR system precrRNA processing endoribonuclease RAMP protein Cas6 [Candidatus Methanomethylicaceae archaeon]